VKQSDVRRGGPPRPRPVTRRKGLADWFLLLLPWAGVVLVWYAVPILQKTRYQNVPLDDLWAQYRAQKVFTAAEWVKLYRDGTVVRWLNQVTNFNVEVGAFQTPVPAERYFDGSLYLEEVRA
jgi:hypothetical protein